MFFSLPSPRRPRHPLMRALSLLLGLAIIGVFLAVGLAVAAVLAVVGALLLAWRQWKYRNVPRQPAAQTQQSPSSAAQPNGPAVLEGEFAVIQPSRSNTH